MFSWDENKARRNREKHGISFFEATRVFFDPLALEWEDVRSYPGEVRFRRIGRIADTRIILIVYTIRRLENGKETIRIISARQASRKERKAYTRPDD